MSPATGSANLCLVVGRHERPTGIETGVVLSSADVLADLAAFHAQGLKVDEHPLAEGEVVWWSGAPLVGVPTQFRLHDPYGNSFLIVAAPIGDYRFGRRGDPAALLAFFRKDREGPPMSSGAADRHRKDMPTIALERDEHGLSRLTMYLTVPLFWTPGGRVAAAEAL